MIHKAIMEGTGGRDPLYGPQAWTGVPGDRGGGQANRVVLVPREFLTHFGCCSRDAVLAI